MSEFRGHQCDGCGAIIAEGQRTKHTERFDGPVVSGEITKDLCVSCAQAKLPEDQSSLRKLRRRKGGKDEESEVA